jgi:hypothetical protein
VPSAASFIPRKVAGLLLAASLLGGCAAPKSATTSDEARDAAYISHTLAYTLHARAPSLKIGSADCSARTSSDVYFRICTLAIDGKAVPVGFKFDDMNERITPHLLWGLVKLKSVEAAVTGVARYEYGVNATTICPGSRERLLPPGAKFECYVETIGRRYTTAVTVEKGPYGPYTAVGAISGLRLDPRVAAVEQRIAEQLRGPDTLSGPLVAQYFYLVTLRHFNDIEPELHTHKIECPHFLSPGDLNAFCLIDSSFGYLRLGIAADEKDEIHFHWLSMPTNMRAAERAGKRLAEATYQRKGLWVIAHVDCGKEKWVPLTLPSVHYCDVRLSNGQTSRLGVEYYDEIEGIHLSFERLPSQAASR